MMGVTILPKKPPNKTQSVATVDKELGLTKVRVIIKIANEIAIISNILVVAASEIKSNIVAKIKPTCRSREKNFFILSTR
tara:strand:- start:158 stop:397 length:240 start_codon:yes stop_codon:yes gene_type:complete